MTDRNERIKWLRLRAGLCHAAEGQCRDNGDRSIIKAERLVLERQLHELTTGQGVLVTPQSDASEAIRCTQ